MMTLSKLMEWQDISTAPKDGTFILLYSPGDGRADLGVWQDTVSWGECWTDDDMFCNLLNPTHWIPLPPIPEVKS